MNINRKNRDQYSEIFAFAWDLFKFLSVIFVVYKFLKQVIYFFTGDSTYVPINVLGRKFILMKPKDTKTRKEILNNYRKKRMFSHDSTFMDENTYEKKAVLAGDDFTDLLR